MANFLEQRRDWRIGLIIKNRDQGLISDAEADEQIQLADEIYDKARRWRENIG